MARKRYDIAIVDFFKTSLQSGSAPRTGPGAVQVIER